MEAKPRQLLANAAVSARGANLTASTPALPRLSLSRLATRSFEPTEGNLDIPYCLLELLLAAPKNALELSSLFSRQCGKIDHLRKCDEGHYLPPDGLVVRR